MRRRTIGDMSLAAFVAKGGKNERPAAPAPGGFASPPLPKRPRRKAPTEGVPRLTGELANITPVRLLCGGASGTGKTHSITQLIVDNDIASDRVYWFGPSESIKQRRLIETQDRLGKGRMVLVAADPGIGITPAQGEQLFKELKQAQDAGLRTLVVCDDLAITASKNPVLTRLFVNGRHLGCSLAELTQKLFVMGDKDGQTRRLNATHFMLHWLTGYKQVHTLAGSYHVKDSNDATDMNDAYKHCMERPGHGLGAYLLIDTVSARSADPDVRKFQYRDSGVGNYVDMT